MIILCVDGVDPDLVYEYDWGNLFDYNLKLEIPRECYIHDGVKFQPHTTRVWATIFSGKVIDYGLIKREGLRKIAHNFLVKNKIVWRKAKQYKVAPVNEGLDTIFNHYKSFTWNIPTICPEWIATFPNYEAFERYCKRELWFWHLITQGAAYFVYPVQAYYLRYVDYVGHNHPDRLKDAYNWVFLHAKDLMEKEDIIFLSDHGCKDGFHTDYAYLGTNFKCECENITELRSWFESLFDEKEIEKI